MDKNNEVIFNPKEIQNMVFIFSKQSANKIFVESILQQSAKVWQSSLKMKNSDELKRIQENSVQDKCV